MKNKFVPFYFPQLHQIPENDTWWGEKYTDWDRVKSAKPLEKNHYQPRVPLNSNYYDQSKESTIQSQIDLAISHNIYGFNFYHYWFNGKLLLEKPIQKFKKINKNLKFCITWANETWTKRWDGKFNEILIEQNHKYDKVEWSNHFEYLYQFFSDPNYICIEDKPVFCIYRPDIFPDVDDFVIYFQELAKSKGLKGIHFIGIKAYETNKTFVNFDSYMRFQPRSLFNTLNKKSKFLQFLEKTLRSFPEKHQILIGELMFKYQNKLSYDYNKFCDLLINIAKADKNNKIKIYQSVIPDWDNTARYRDKARYFKNVTPDKFEKLIINLLEIYSDDPNNLIFINAWNEWSEGAYLEPDEKNGLKYLEILKKLSTY